MIPALYNLVLLLALPPLAALTLLRHIRRGRLRQGWSERLGRLPDALVNRCAGREVIWVHAVSVGETAAARPLLAELRRRRPGAVLLLSHVTETGREAAQKAGADALLYLPLDLPGVVDHVLDQLHPALLATVDTELWPNLFWAAHRRGVRLAVTNGRISDRSFRRIAKLRARWLYRWTLSHVDRLLMQSEQDAARVKHLGADAARTRVTGNLKADEPHPEVDAARQAWWRDTLGLGDDGPVLLAGSTGGLEEEAAVLTAYERLRQEHPAARLVLVPRAIDRAGEIERLVTSHGHAAVRRSRLPGEADRSREQRAVVIVDTIGELAELFAVGTVAFVGRSLVPLGGSNVLQAAAQGRYALTGPHVNNVRDSVALLVEAGVAEVVRDADELSAAVLRLVGDPARLEAIDARARATVAASRGAAARTADALIELLHGRR